MGIEVIYTMIINDMELNDYNLEKYGFTKEDIDNLISTNMIKLSNDKYELVSVKMLFRYGMQLFKSRSISSASACFCKCYELNPNNNKFCYQALTIELKRQNKLENRHYDKAFKIFQNIEKNSKKPFDIKITLLYLYLFSYIYSDLPNEYRNIISNTKRYDLFLERKTATKEENEIIRAIIRKRFKYAINLLDNLINKQNDYSIRYESLRALLNEVIDSENHLKRRLITLIKEEKYEEIIKILKTRAELVGLSNTEENTLLVIESIIEILSTKEIPSINKEKDYSSLHDIIYNKDYELAYNLVSSYLKEHQLDNNNILLAALVKILLLIESINPKKVSNMEELAYFIKEENISIGQAHKKYGLTLESILLIKLIYIRDYYIESKYLEGDTLLKEVEEYKGIFTEIDIYIEELKRNRDNLKTRFNTYTRKSAN